MLTDLSALYWNNLRNRKEKRDNKYGSGVSLGFKIHRCQPPIYAKKTDLEPHL